MSHLRNSILVPMGKKLSVVTSNWLLVIGNWGLVISDPLSVTGDSLFVIRKLSSELLTDD